MIRTAMAWLLGLAGMAAVPGASAEAAGQIVHVWGDGSHLAIVDLDRYQAFVGDWDQDDRLRKHLLAQAGREAIVAWGAGFETDWVVSIRPGFSARQGFREFRSVISTQTGRLYLLNYDSLTMAAQFDDYRLPDKDTVATAFQVPPGRYRARIVQLVDPDTVVQERDDRDPEFLIEYEPAGEQDHPQQAVPWAGF